MARSLDEREAPPDALSTEEPAVSSEDGERDAPGLSKKGAPWSEREHLAFLEGLNQLGKGNWRGISRLFVPSRSPTQVASHAQKYFLRVSGVTKRRSRFSVLEAPHRGAGSGKVARASSTTEDSESSPTTSSGCAPPASADTSSGPVVSFPYNMMPPMMLAFPNGAPYLQPVFFQSPSSYTKQGAQVMPIYPGYTATGVPALVTGDIAGKDKATVVALPSAPVSVCKPSALQASCDTQRTAALLSQLPVSNCTSVELHPSAHSAFRPLSGIRAA
mmetsp:Transcript_34448/g.76546  ORF Transcript_34448/g.76546 Transcript_34448/m.76546 type:complete len:274 (-) Transcript_34448:1716-2537(-)|eukprot:CAMPEP_0202904846 /NCGR_PEP_ID=MMETSP1392-20130828/31392_1 /ASSEMBLY_ACC=CAM_ASM_000868 /TAXON_ID=225041 /ORGANISM="Chlamydomonas chlamydogama, Strain SAG 11-48b" /LENGTH=273 /DNA_ID=CAMNT_0049592685 /DNA_START=122 /DNA_END=943 /DNA_ORIENTATION=+